MKANIARMLLYGGIMCSAITVATVSTGLPAFAGEQAARTVATLPKVFAPAISKTTKPDDLTMLDGLLYVTYQNNAGPDGSPTGSRSTVKALNPSGHPTQSWSIPGRVDGLTADPTHHRVLATINEDLNSRLDVLTPGVTAPHQFSYSPAPAQSGTDGSNGGTDSISVANDGSIYLAHSNPDPTLPSPNNAPALYRATLSGSTASLTPVFGINDSAPVINPAAGQPSSGKLGLTDPDSNRIVSIDGVDTLIQDAQADSKLVFLKILSNSAAVIGQLLLHNSAGSAAITPQLDDIEQITGPGTLYIADQSSGIIYAMDTKGIASGTLVVSQPKPSKGDLKNTAAVATLDPGTGVVTPLLSNLMSPKGLLFVPAASGGNQTTSTALGGLPADVTPPVAVNSGRADWSGPNLGMISAGVALLVAAGGVALIAGRRHSQRR